MINNLLSTASPAEPCIWTTRPSLAPRLVNNPGLIVPFKLFIRNYYFKTNLNYSD